MICTMGSNVTVECANRQKGVFFLLHLMELLLGVSATNGASPTSVETFIQILIFPVAKLENRLRCSIYIPVAGTFVWIS